MMRNILNADVILTYWDIAIIPSSIFVSGVTPQPIGFVIWVTAVVTGVIQGIVREFRHIIAGVFVRALAVPALAHLPRAGYVSCTVIFRTHFCTFAALKTCVREDPTPDLSIGAEIAMNSKSEKCRSDYWN